MSGEAAETQESPVFSPWEVVAANAALAHYHLMLVDLLRHGGSCQVAPIPLLSAADAVADISLSREDVSGRFHSHLASCAPPGRALLSCFPSGAIAWHGSWALVRDFHGSCIGLRALYQTFSKVRDPDAGTRSCSLSSAAAPNGSFALKAFTSMLSDFGWAAVEDEERSVERVLLRCGREV
ncbi:hypothetical protein BX600DRAFT_514476 [Xylariales sp. PMI_506]|nr:hypothetical protein BX600DRAFT_514476 [Xylariales sp. PMI_506]